MTLINIFLRKSKKKGNEIWGNIARREWKEIGDEIMENMSESKLKTYELIRDKYERTEDNILSNIEEEEEKENPNERIF